MEAFLPMQSLKKVFHISNARAMKAVETLTSLRQSSANHIVQMNEFLLNETMAQLMLVMFGIPEDMEVVHNKQIRNAFAAALDATGGAVGGAKPNLDQAALSNAAATIFSFIGEFLDVAEEKAGVTEQLAGERELDGPLSARINDISDNIEERIYNAATFIFAGHDTTANTMSWLLYEVCRNPHIQGEQSMLDVTGTALCFATFDIEMR